MGVHSLRAQPVPMVLPTTAVLPRGYRTRPLYGVRFSPAGFRSLTHLPGILPLRARVLTPDGRRVIDPELVITDDSWRDFGGQLVSLELFSVCQMFAGSPVSLFDIEWTDVPMAYVNVTARREALLLWDQTTAGLNTTPQFSMYGLSEVGFLLTNPAAAPRNLTMVGLSDAGDLVFSGVMRAVPAGLPAYELGTIGFGAAAAVAPIAWSVALPLPPLAGFELQNGAVAARMLIWAR